MKNQKLNVLAISVLFLAPNCFAANSRKPASNADFDVAQIQKSLNQDYKKLEELYVISQNSLAEFDKDLAEGKIKKGYQTSNEAHLKLVTAWAMRDEAQENIMKNLSLLESSKLGLHANSAEADKTRDAFLKKLNSANGIAKLATDELISQMREPKRWKEYFSESKEASRAQKDLTPSRAVLSISDFKKEKIKIDFTSASKEHTVLPSFQSEFLAAKAAHVEARLHLEKEKISGKKIQPSVDSNGNLTGQEFPEKTFALTFDDGPSKSYSIPMLDVLQEHGNPPVTFFCLAEFIQYYPKTTDRQKTTGFAQGNHSFHHPHLSKLSDADLDIEIVESSKIDEKHFGHKPEYFRCPYGEGVNIPKIRQKIADQGMVHVFWNIDSTDYADKDPDSIFQRVKKLMAIEGKGIVLMHDIHPQTVEATKKILAWIDSNKGTDKEIRLVSIPQIVKELNRD